MSKFNKEQKIEIYRKWKDEKISISQLSKAYKMNLANLDYMLRLIDMHGTDILNTRKRVYSKKFKEQTIEQAIFGTKSDVQLSLELGFKSIGMLNNWLREYKEKAFTSLLYTNLNNFGGLPERLAEAVPTSLNIFLCVFLKLELSILSTLVCLKIA